MPGGPGKIDEYNKSLTPEQRREKARRAGSIGGKKAKTMRDIARAISRAKAPEDAQESMKMLGINDEDMTNAALLVSKLFNAASDGNMGAYDRYVALIGENAKEEQGRLADLIDGLREDDES